MRKDWALYALISCIMCSCIVDKKTVYVANLHNDSGVPILVLPYKSGAVRPSDTIMLNNNGTREIARGTTLGEVKTPFFESDILAIGEDDSIVVVFDSDFRVTHYVNEPENKPEKYHLYESDRNLVRRENYIFKSVETKKLRTNHHDYYFTEKDYEYATE